MFVKTPPSPVGSTRLHFFPPEGREIFTGPLRFPQERIQATLPRMVPVLTSLLRFTPLVVLFGGILAIAAFCQPSRISDAEIDALAADAHVVVGDVPLVLPFIAIARHASMAASFSLNRRRARTDWQERRDAFRAAASDPATAPRADKLRVVIDSYGLNDFDPSMRRICGRLTRGCQKPICDDAWAPLRQSLPRTYLADDRMIHVFDSHGAVGGERVSDQLRAMSLHRGRASVGCDREASSTTHFCTAAIPIDRHLIAVWTVWDDERETSAAMAKLQCRAIATLVRHGLGPSEDVPRLQEVACGTRRPGSTIWSEPDPCDEV